MRCSPNTSTEDLEGDRQQQQDAPPSSFRFSTSFRTMFVVVTFALAVLSGSESFSAFVDQAGKMSDDNTSTAVLKSKERGGRPDRTSSQSMTASLLSMDIENIPATFNVTDVSSWSTFPVRGTQFTHHILELIYHRSLTADVTTIVTDCSQVTQLAVSRPFQVPNVTFLSDFTGDTYDYNLLRRVFANQLLPYNVTVGFHHGDSADAADFWSKPCWANSVRNGMYSITNMEERREMELVRHQRGEGSDKHRWSFSKGKDDLPWENRQTIPVFRGTLWDWEGGNALYDATVTSRWNAVNYSIHHPDLLNARFSGIRTSAFRNDKNDTTLQKMLVTDSMSHTDYFHNHQVAVVLAGIGAAFRLATHLMARTAVILQEIEVQEWYTKYLQPYVHYIPLRGDISDIESVLVWVRDHPKEVQGIAENGRLFWEQFLTFDRSEQHLYELLYRISEFERWRDLVVRTDRNATVIWDGATNPLPAEMRDTIRFPPTDEMLRMIDDWKSRSEALHLPAKKRTRRILTSRRLQ
jgi:hypothetical protein